MVRERPEQTIRLELAPTGASVGVFSVRNRDGRSFYVLREIPCDIGGRGFAVHRLGLGELYHVRIGQARDCSCECMGFLAHGRCKHVLGLLALAERGLI